MLKNLLIAGAATAVFATPAMAEGEWSGNVTLTTDYTWRGISQSNEDFALQGGFDYANGLFYAGTWASNVDFSDEPEDTNMELDLYAGLAGETESGLGWDVGVIYYAYPDAETADLDFVEVYGGVSTELEGGLGLGGYIYWDPDNESFYVEGTAGYGISDNLSVDVSLGNYSFDGGGDYTNWSLGTTLSAEGFDFDLRYWGNDVDGGGDIADDRIILSVSRSL